MITVAKEDKFTLLSQYQVHNISYSERKEEEENMDLNNKGEHYSRIETLGAIKYIDH